VTLKGDQDVYLGEILMQSFCIEERGTDKTAVRGVARGGKTNLNSKLRGTSVDLLSRRLTPRGSS
jgi:hypothetical protein